MSHKDEFKRHMRNALEDLEKGVSRKWSIEYEGHIIEIINEVKEEALFIDGKMVDQNIRKSILSHIIPYTHLSGTLTLQDGTKEKVSVKIGGFVKLNCIVKVGNKTVFEESEKVEFLPWENKEKIVPYILQQIEEHNKIVEDSLPDDRYFYDEDDPKFAPGFRDYLADDFPTPFFAKKLVKLFTKQVNEPNHKTRRATYEHLIYDNIASYGNEFIELFQETELDKSLIQQEAIWMLEHACHREVVKFSLVVLGFTNCDFYKEQLLKIGMHEEFTSYVIFALKNGTSQPNESIWQLAQSVHGWGKIEAVQQLETTTPEIRRWILTKGCENTIRNFYLAYECAIKGKLDIELYEDEISREIYEGTRIIIEALISREGPAETIDDYPYAGAVLSRFVQHSIKHCSTLEDFHLLIKINEFINEDDEKWEERFNNNWKQHERNTIKELLPTFFNDSKWVEQAQEQLRQNFDYTIYEILKFYHIDFTNELFNYLEKEPTNGQIYYAIMETGNKEHITKLCSFAESHLPLLTEQLEGQICLQMIVQSLHDYEGIGLPIVKAALNSKIGQYQALTVLNSWPKSVWNQPDIEETLKQIATTEKDKEDRNLAKQLLAK